MTTHVPQQTQTFSLRSPFLARMSMLTGLTSFGFSALVITILKSQGLNVWPTFFLVWLPALVVFAVIGISLNASWKKVTGKEVQIEGDEVRLISSNNKLTFAAHIANVTKLRSIKPMFARNPEAFCVEFNDGHKFYFRDDIPNREFLMQLLEQKSGLKFEVGK